MQGIGDRVTDLETLVGAGAAEKVQSLGDRIARLEAAFEKHIADLEAHKPAAAAD